MNRRQFFGMSALAVAAAGLPALVLPERTIFLPPKWGWKPHALADGYMRETRQYNLDLDDDPEEFRYDTMCRDIWGNEHQFHVHTRGRYPEIARTIIANQFQHDGLIALAPGQARHFKLLLPRGVPARYV